MRRNISRLVLVVAVAWAVLATVARPALADGTAKARLYMLQVLQEVGLLDGTNASTSVPTTRTVTATAPLSGGGALSGNITITLPTTATPQIAQLGLGTAPVGTNTITAASPGMSVSGQYASVQVTCTTPTVNWASGNCQSMTLANGAQTFTTFSNGIPGGRYLLRLRQPSSGAAGTVTWPGQVHWSADTAPTLTTTNGQVDLVTFYYDGSTYFAAADLNFTP